MDIIYSGLAFLTKPVAWLFGPQDDITIDPLVSPFSQSFSSVERTTPTNRHQSIHASYSYTIDDEYQDPEDTIPADLLCPICRDLFTDVIVTACGHSFCNQCISQLMTRNQTFNCPICRLFLDSNELFPNFQIAKVVERYQENKRCCRKRIRTSDIDTQRKRVRIIDDLTKSFSYEEFDRIVMPILEQKTREELGQNDVENVLMEGFLEQIKSDHMKKITILRSQLRVIEKDLHSTQSELKKYEGFYKVEAPCAVQEGSTSISRSSAEKRKLQALLGVSPSQSDQEESDEVRAKRQKLYNRFHDLQDMYIEESCTGSNILTVDSMRSVLYQTTKYGSLRELGTICDFRPTDCSYITASIAFDRDNEYFAVAGVSKKIMIFDYHTIADTFETPESSIDSKSSYPRRRSGFIGEERRPHFIHNPSATIDVTSKLSCLSWNPYLKSHLMGSDYDGYITLWDTTENRYLHIYSEHRDRAWCVDVSAAVPTLAASASDDGTVKIWSTATRFSTTTLDIGQNVYSAKFAPSSANYIAVGTAGHIVSYYDLRYPSNPVKSFQGHKGAISHVRWLNDTNIISTSTDSTLCRWDITSTDPTTIYTGHTNERNFVGVSVSGDLISCGSEDNSVYAYHKNLKSPIANYNFPTIPNLCTGRACHNYTRYGPYVNASCWKGDSNILLAANSKGIIKALQLDEL